MSITHCLWFESGEGLANWLYQRPMLGFYNIKRELRGSVGDDLETRFMTPFDVGWDFLVKFNHEFTGKKALEKIAKERKRTVVTLEWNAEDIGKTFATRFMPGKRGVRIFRFRVIHSGMRNKRMKDLFTAPIRYLQVKKKLELLREESYPTHITV